MSEVEHGDPLKAGRGPVLGDRPERTESPPLCKSSERGDMGESYIQKCSEEELHSGGEIKWNQSLTGICAANDGLASQAQAHKYESDSGNQQTDD